MLSGVRREAFGTWIRDVGVDDASFMYGLRTAEHARGRIGDPPPSVEAQRRWIEQIIAAPNELCFIIHQKYLGPVGTACLTLLGSGVVEPGRWVMTPLSLAAAAGVLLVYSVAFELLGSNRLVYCVVSDNYPVIHFHQRYGARFSRVETAARRIAGEWRDLVWFELDRSMWPDARAYLENQAAVSEKMMDRIWGQEGKVAST